MPPTVAGRNHPRVGAAIDKDEAVVKRVDEMWSSLGID